MKRLSIADAFARMSAPGLSDTAADQNMEAVSLVVRGGELIAVVPRGTPDDQVEDLARVVRGCLRLESERVLTFQVPVSAGSTAFEDLHARLHPSQHYATADSGPTQTARDIMTREVVTIEADMLVEDAAKLLAYHNISGMPVEDPDGKVCGIVSEADVIGHIGAIVSDVMTPEVVSVGESATVEEIATLMAQHRIKRVPVMNNGSLLGMVSRSDIVRAIAARV
jgi:CBS domain-containing protein